MWKQIHLLGERVSVLLSLVVVLRILGSLNSFELLELFFVDCTLAGIAILDGDVSPIRLVLIWVFLASSAI